MAASLWHLEHVSDQVYQTICKVLENFTCQSCIMFTYCVNLSSNVSGWEKAGKGPRFIRTMSRDLSTKVCEKSVLRFFRIKIGFLCIAKVFSILEYLIFLCNHTIVDLYLLYAKLEEDFGMARHAMSIYNRATRAVDKDDMHRVKLFLWCFCQMGSPGRLQGSQNITLAIDLLTLGCKGFFLERDLNLGDALL